MRALDDKKWATPHPTATIRDRADQMEECTGVYATHCDVEKRLVHGTTELVDTHPAARVRHARFKTSVETYLTNLASPFVRLDTRNKGHATSKRRGWEKVSRRRDVEMNSRS